MWGLSKVVRIDEYTELWLSWLRLSDSGSIGQFCEQAKTICHPQKEKIHRSWSRALPKLSEKAPRWGSQHFERFCKAQIPHSAPDPGGTIVLRTGKRKEKQIFQDGSQWQMQRPPEGMADTFCSSGQLENCNHLLSLRSITKKRRYTIVFGYYQEQLEWLWANFTIKL